jgi:hypothetical protein
MLRQVKQRLVNWLLKDAHIERLEVGKHTVSIDGNNITLPGTVDGVDISAHAANADAHHARSHDHSLAADGSPIALAGIPATLTGKDADTVDGQHRVLTINADHTHQSTGAEGGTLDAAAIASGELSAARLSANIKTLTITFIIDGGGSAITTGQKGHLEIPFACTIQQVTMLADQTGSIVVDIWKDTYANFPPTDADSITASTPPTISDAQKSQDSTLTGWTTSISAGNILAFNVDSCTTITRVTISLKVVKS